MRISKLLLPLLVVGALLLTSCRPWTGSVTVAAGGYRCVGKVGITARESGVDRITTSFPATGQSACADSAGYRAEISMRIITESDPTGTVVAVGLGETSRSAYGTELVRLRLKYKTRCNTAVLDVAANRATTGGFYPC